MSNSNKRHEVNCQVSLGNGTVITLANRIVCPECGVTLRAIDAEPLEPGIRLICRNNHFIFSIESAR